MNRGKPGDSCQVLHLAMFEAVRRLKKNITIAIEWRSE